MTFPLFAGMALAVCSAVCSNSGMVLEKLAIRQMPVLHARRSFEMVRMLFGAPRWVLGFVLLGAALVSQVVALTLAPISLVQGIGACGIVFLLALSHVALGDRLGRFEYVGMALVVLALILLGFSVDPHADRATASGTFGSVAVAAIPALIASICFFFAAERVHTLKAAGPRLRAPLFGISSGLLYGVAALGVKAISAILKVHGLVSGIPLVLASPAPYLLGVASALGFLVFQTALQRCVASVLVPVNNVTGSAYFILVGSAIFHEHLPGAAQPLALRLAAFAAIIAGLCALSMGQAIGGVVPGEPVVPAMNLGDQHTMGVGGSIDGPRLRSEPAGNEE